ncbi:cytochrome P450 family protein, putative [Ichthyophthirius multifiliis]|uniref:Cytochrome P450 family protein, putative n=1 Tax=Ichthyophthirius multifiliis TaxID=5932 RepID=G0QM00_ICHMU|nr:cytochrome P450 family protein, putative [Ichthyophthirius multifiliis]EGR33755.1 cytochrome P450 family protein, putative [Ichthyophthirius multifiliis]|eukprot:XP_004038979.1 cytochrome P450 family protein, putative [Ichthyophthirius multifiliis]
MIINIILFSLIIFIIFILTKLIFIPYLRFCNYVKFGKGNFYPILGVLAVIQKIIQVYKDIYYYFKHVHDDGKNSRIYVQNYFSKITIGITDTNLLKAFISVEDKYYEKDPYFTKALKRLMGDGILFSKGQKWKNNRTAMSAIFHFDSLQQRIMTIENLTKKHF